MRGSKTSVNQSAVLLAVALATMVGLATHAASTPHPTSAVIRTRIFNDCPLSILTTTDSYPALIQVSDQNPGSCYGYANLHVWRLSADGVTPADFSNGDSFKIAADMKISGTGDAYRLEGNNGIITHLGREDPLPEGFHGQSRSHQIELPHEE